MPQIFPKNIVSFSSEDKAFPASNLLKSSSFNKWRSAKGGTSREVVELDFGEPVEVSRLDIGNNGSAFIEVLVRRSASSDDPMVFVPCSSFMSPMDAKNETNLTRVRVFSGDQLYDVAAKQKWDIFRLVCTQPFNKNLPCGISFVSFHSPASKDQPASNVANSTTTPTSANISLADDEVDDSDSSEFRPGALFQASKSSRSASAAQNSMNKLHATVLEKLRAANQSASGVKKPTASDSVSNSPVDAPVSEPVVPPSPVRVPKPSKPLTMSSDRSNSASPQPSTSHVKPTSIGTASKKSNNHSRTPNQSSGSEPSTSAAAANSGSSRRPLTGVVFSLSGYQNPLRSELRQKALDLGAKFRQNWDRDCTHLICAFPNTPKFKEVCGKGIIVSDKWIQQCYTSKSKVDWRPYRVGRAPSPSSTSASSAPVATASNTASDDEFSEGSPKSKMPHKLRKRTRDNNEDNDWQPTADDEEDDDDDDEEEEKSEVENEESEPEEYDDSEDEDKAARSRTKTTTSRTRKPIKSEARKRSRTPPPNKKARSTSSKPSDPEEEDTDDEIQRVMKPSHAEDEDRSSANGATQSPDRSGSLPALPDLFENTHFFVHNKAIPNDEERMIQRLIVAFAGTLHQYMHSDVQFVITRSTWNKEFDEALADNPNLLFVRPDWIFACDEQAKRMPFQKYLVVG